MAKSSDNLLTYVIVAGVVYFAHKEGIINLNDIINELKNLFKPGTTPTTPTTPTTCPTGQVKNPTTGACEPEEEEGGGEEEEGGGEEEEEEEEEEANLARVYSVSTKKINFENEGLYVDRITMRDNW